MANILDSSKFVGVKDVKEGVVIREDETMVGILLVNSINFSLKSDEERSGILNGFQNLLNTLGSDAQIIIQSRKSNIDPYIESLKEIKRNQTNELLKVQTEGYIQFIESFTKKVDILTKNFFFVVKYTPTGISKDSFLSFFKRKKNPVKKENDFLENLSQLRQRMGSVQQRLNSIGLKSVQLNSEQTTQLLYETFNVNN